MLNRVGISLGGLACTAFLAAPASAAPPALGEHPRMRAALAMSEMWLEHQAMYREAPGMSVAIVHDQDVLWRGGFGFADVEAGIAATPRTRYSICSITKVFTATAMMQLRDAGQLGLDDPVATLLPWFAARRDRAESGQVTVRGLLTHTSGLPKDLDLPYWSDQSFPVRDQFLAALERTPLLHRASEVEEYSNIGPTLAGMIVEARSGQPYEAYVRNQILAPLQMEDTTMGMPEGSARTGMAVGYTGFGREHRRKIIPPYELRALAPAVGMVSTVDDLAKFVSWQFRLLSRGSTEVLKADTLREMHRVQWYEKGSTSHVGLSYSIADIGGRLYVGKDGGCPGYQSLLLMGPVSKLGVLVMINANDVDVWELARGIFELLEPVIGEVASGSAGSDPDPALARYAGVYRGYPADMEVGIVTLGRELVMVPLHQKNPAKAIVRLTPAGEHRFARHREGTFRGHLTFMVDERGLVTGFRQPGSEWPKVPRDPR